MFSVPISAFENFEVACSCSRHSADFVPELQIKWGMVGGLRCGRKGIEQLGKVFTRLTPKQLKRAVRLNDDVVLLGIVRFVGSIAPFQV